MIINKNDLTFKVHDSGYEVYYKNQIIREVIANNTTTKSHKAFYFNICQEFIDMIITGRNLPLWLVFKIDEIDKIDKIDKGVEIK